MPVAPLWLRPVALVIDVVVLLMAVMPLWIVLTFMAGFSANVDSPASNVVSSLTLLMFITLLLYEPFFVSLTGTTLGKTLVGIRVVRSDGGRLGFRLSIGRFAVKLLSTLPLGLGFLLALFDDEGRTWYDRVSDTIVVRTRSARPLETAPTDMRNG